MKHCDFMIGNSSSGIWEGPSFNCAYINVGERQSGRKKGNNVLSVSGYKQSDIHRAINSATSKKFKERIVKSENPYGDGEATKKIITRLKTVDLDLALRKKIFGDISFQ